MTRLQYRFKALAKRSSLALLTNVLSSIGNFGLTVGIARTTNVEGVGAYGLAFALYALTTGITRAAVTEGRLADLNNHENSRATSQRVSTVGTLCAVVVLVIAIPANSSYLAVLGLGLHGLVMYDYAKVSLLAMGDSGIAFRRELIWTSATLAAFVAALLGWLTATSLFAIWISAGTILGYSFYARTLTAVIPHWSIRQFDRLSLTYALDFLAGSGSTQLSMAGLGLAPTNAVLGAMRSGATLLSPINLVTGTARSLAIRPLAQLADTRNELRVALISTFAIALFSLPLAAVAVFLPDSLGQILLGDSWEHAKVVVLPLAIEALLAIASTMAFAGHRAHKAGTNTLLIRLSLAPIRISAVLYFGIVYGAAEAAWAMVAVSSIAVAVWWISYKRVVNQDLTGKST